MSCVLIPCYIVTVYTANSQSILQLVDKTSINRKSCRVSTIGFCLSECRRGRVCVYIIDAWSNERSNSLTTNFILSCNPASYKGKYISLSPQFGSLNYGVRLILKCFTWQLKCHDCDSPTSCVLWLKCIDQIKDQFIFRLFSLQPPRLSDRRRVRESLQHESANLTCHSAKQRNTTLQHSRCNVSRDVNKLNITAFARISQN